MKGAHTVLIKEYVPIVCANRVMIQDWMVVVFEYAHTVMIHEWMVVVQGRTFSKDTRVDASSLSVHHTVIV